MTSLRYCPQSLSYEVGYLPLDWFEKKRVDMIYDINRIGIAMGRGPLTTAEFDKYWDSSPQILEAVLSGLSHSLRTNLP